MAALRSLDGAPDEALAANVAGLNSFDRDAYGQLVAIVFAFLTQSVKVRARAHTDAVPNAVACTL
jgi:hypothetical protein